MQEITDLLGAADGELSTSKSSVEDVADQVVEAEIEQDDSDSEGEETKKEELDEDLLPSQYRKSIIKKSLLHY